MPKSNATSRDQLLEAVKARLLSLGGDATQGFGGFQRPDFVHEEARWLPLDALLTAEPRRFDGGRLMQGQPNSCHDNARTLAAQRGWTVYSGFALSKGIWRVHSWLIIPSTGRLVETTEPAELYVGAPCNDEQRRVRVSLSAELVTTVDVTAHGDDWKREAYQSAVHLVETILQGALAGRMVTWSWDVQSDSVVELEPGTERRKADRIEGDA